MPFLDTNWTSNQSGNTGNIEAEIENDVAECYLVSLFDDCQIDDIHVSVEESEIGSLHDRNSQDIMLANSLDIKSTKEERQWKALSDSGANLIIITMNTAQKLARPLLTVAKPFHIKGWNNTDEGDGEEMIVHYIDGGQLLGKCMSVKRRERI